MPGFASRPDAVRPLPENGLLRSLDGGDRMALRGHLTRLDPDSRRLRFGVAASDDFILDYAEGAIGAEALLKGLIIDGVLRGVAQLQFQKDGRLAAEAAFSVERDWQGLGHGARLFASLVDAARNRGIARLVLHVSRENAAMQRIVRRYGAALAFEGGELVAEIRSPAADAASQSRERAEDRASAIERAVRRGLYALASGAGVDLSLRAA